MNKDVRFAPLAYLIMLTGCGGGSGETVQSAYSSVQTPAGPAQPAVETPAATPAPAPAAPPAADASAWRSMTEIPLNFGTQNAKKAWSFTSWSTISRYEIRSGDIWAIDADLTRERSESASRFLMESGKTYQLEYSIMIEPGAPNTAQWLDLTQMQSTFDTGEIGHSPPFALELLGSRFRVVSRYSQAQISSTSDTRMTIHYTDSMDLKPGQWYKFQYVVKFDPFGTGHLVVIRDGRTLVDYTGPIGFNDIRGPYVKTGIYRAAAPETFAVQFDNIHFGVQTN